ncbi:MAG: hypothetical protein RL324_711 [Verrucomicrobiota bacterium]|jgi:hypothetical protein
MARTKDPDPPGHGRLLDAWTPPAGAGEALGCFATTFTFHPSFFESDCLGRMLQLESDPDSNTAAYLIEREEKMAKLMCAGVVVDQAHARGQRSLRWDLIPFRAGNGILHAKLAILLWQNTVRVIVSSANLTEPGYRQNLEVFTVWDFHREGSVPASFFSVAADFATEVIDHCQAQRGGVSPALDRCRKFLRRTRRDVAAWLPDEVSVGRFRSALVPLTPTSHPVLEQLRTLWPTGSPPETLYVLSPFFDQGRGNAPADAAWLLLRQRGEASIRYSVVAEPIDSSGKLMVNAPKTLVGAIPSGRPTAEVKFERIAHLDGRPLHAKSLWIDNADHFLHCIGSSNFTSAGLGLSGLNRNWELNVASWARYSDRDEYRTRNSAWPALDDELLDPAKLAWQPAPGAEDEVDPNVFPLPNWCGSAVYFTDSQGGAKLELCFCGSPPVKWSVGMAEDSGPLLDVAMWRGKGSPEQIELTWMDSKPPSELYVRVPGNATAARWPVEVREFADLPPPQELRDLTLEQLLEILTSALPLHRCLERMRRQDRNGAAPEGTPSPALDPLRRFSRDHHLLERTRRFSLAMTGIRRRLEAPISSEEYLKWRLHGPVGVTKVAEAVLREAGSDEEKAFLLGEMALELSKVAPAGAPSCLRRERIREAIGEQIAGFSQQVEKLLKGSESELSRYVAKALKEAQA